MAKFNVSVTTTLYTTLCIEAKDKDAAINTACDLCFDREGVAAIVLDAFDNDYEAWRVKNWDFSFDSTANEDDVAINE